ncbi:cyclin-D1-1-like [Magnolia sinica]|uniref:cyclin-D1-1-like n=1 Tax=Magnolia sinica TaxID=86752 RepID=UPI0026583439|nr:cyclin-D1-1-like [Magnolia sinica]
MSASSASNLFCPEDAASWDSDTWTPTPPPQPCSSAALHHHLPPDNDDRSISALLDSELHHMPESDYLRRFQDRSLDVTARQDAISWMSKVHEYYHFRPVTVYLSVNYLDRFLSSHTLPRGNGWPFQLLSVACLSLAAKMEETDVPLLLDFQLFEPRFVFAPRTIGRMELLVMANLKWRMRSVTPFDFVDFFTRKLLSFGSRHAFCSYRFSSRVSDLILSTHRVIDFLGYRPSTIAAAAVLCAAGEIGDSLAGDDWSAAMFYDELSQELVGRCQQLMEEYLIDTCPAGVKAGPEPTPQSPVGVLDAAACGSCDTQKSASENPDAARAEPSNKRRKPRCTETLRTDDRGKSNV